MAETQRTYNAALALLPDNTNGEISPQDLRDMAETLMMRHGQIYVPVANAADIVVSVIDTWYECTATAWVESASNHGFAETSNGRLYYTGTADVFCHIAFSFSTSLVSGGNDNTHWAIGKNGTPDGASELIRKVSTSGDIGAGACHLITRMSNGDYISVFTKNSSATDNIRLESANLQVVTMPVMT